MKLDDVTNRGGGGGSAAGVGEIICGYWESAPEGYLFCDGTVYNKTDYPDLATHLATLTSAANYVVDGDNTKFKVPDLRGEFLRCTGTNSYTNQGSGVDVGVHQNGTIIPTVVRFNNRYTMGSSGGSFSDTDYMYTQQSGTYYYNTMSSYSDSSKVPCYTTIRPTNTSVLYCIKY